MIEIFAICMLVLCGLMMIWLSWLLKCNNKTAEERRKLIRAAFQHKDSYWMLMNQYDEVSYDEHFKALSFRKNAIDLYHKDLQSVYYDYVSKL